VDSSQIEARGVATLSGQKDLVDQFAQGDDVYSDFAAYVFDKPVNKKDPERFVGKQAVLGLGYGLGAPKFRNRLKTDSKNQTGTAIELDEMEALRIVQAYRNKYHHVPETWRLLNSDGIPALYNGTPFTFGPCVFEKGAILLPSGLRLFYRALHRLDGEWWFTYGVMPKKLYGGKLLENITQALARVIVMDAAVRIRKRTGHNLAMQAHDELVFIVPDAEVETMKVIMLEEMTRRPSWSPDWPLAAELGVGQSYGDAK
jgi:DNA polymerase